MASLRDLVNGSDDDDDDFLHQFAKQQAAFLSRKRRQGKYGGDAALFSEDPFTHTDALKWEEDTVEALMCEYPTLQAALVKATATAKSRQQRDAQDEHHSGGQPFGRAAHSAGQPSPRDSWLRDVCVHAVKLWYPRVWIIPAYTIPEAHFVPLCAEPQMNRLAQTLNDAHVEKLADELVALRGKSAWYSVSNYDYSEERCLVRVLREPIQPHDEKSDIADRQRVLAWWPEGDRSTRKNARVEAVLRSIEIERAKRRQWNQHVAEQLAGSACESSLETATTAAAAIVSAANGSFRGDADLAASVLGATSPPRRKSLATTSTSLFPTPASGPSSPSASVRKPRQSLVMSSSSVFSSVPSSDIASPLRHNNNNNNQNNNRRPSSSSRRRSSVRGGGGGEVLGDDEDDEGITMRQAVGERLYWPALVKRVVGVFEGETMFDDTPQGLCELQSYEDLGDVIAIALTCQMRLCMDVVFAVDEVSECRRLDLCPDVVYAPPAAYPFIQRPSEATTTAAAAAIRDAADVVQRALFPPAATESAQEGGAAFKNGIRSQRERLAAAQVDEEARSFEGDEDVVAAVRLAYAHGDGCTVAEVNEWTTKLRHAQDCPVLTPEVLPEVLSIRNMSFTPAEAQVTSSPLGAHALPPSQQPQQRPCGTLDGASLANNPIALYDLLAGPTCQTRTLVLLRASTEMLSRAQHEAIKDVAERWRRLRQALINRLTAYEEEAAVPVASRAPTPPPSPPPVLVQLPDTFETPFIEASAERADDLPPEPQAQEVMTEDQIRAATRVPALQSHGWKMLGNVKPADPMLPSPPRQPRRATRSPSAVTPIALPVEGRGAMRAMHTGEDGGSPPRVGVARHQPPPLAAATLTADTPSGPRAPPGLARPVAPGALAVREGETKKENENESEREGAHGAAGSGFSPTRSATATLPPSARHDPDLLPPPSHTQLPSASHMSRRGEVCDAEEKDCVVEAPLSLASTRRPIADEDEDKGGTPREARLSSSVRPRPRHTQPSHTDSSTGPPPQPQRRVDGDAMIADHSASSPLASPGVLPTAPPRAARASALNENTAAPPRSAHRGPDPHSLQEQPRTSASSATPHESPVATPRPVPQLHSLGSVAAGTSKTREPPFTPRAALYGTPPALLPVSPSTGAETSRHPPRVRHPIVGGSHASASSSSSSPSPRVKSADAVPRGETQLTPSRKCHHDENHDTRKKKNTKKAKKAKKVHDEREGKEKEKEKEESTPRSSRYVLVRRIVRRDPLNEEVFAPLPSLRRLDLDRPSVSPRADGEGGDVQKSASHRVQVSQSLLTLLPPSSSRKHAADAVPDWGDVTAGSIHSSVLSREKPSMHRVRARTPFPYHPTSALSRRHTHRSLSTSARHHSTSRPDWNTSPLRAMSFRGSRSQSLIHTDMNSPPSASRFGVDVYSLARAATSATTMPSLPIDTEGARGDVEEVDKPPVHHPSALRLHDVPPPQQQRASCLSSTAARPPPPADSYGIMKKSKAKDAKTELTPSATTQKRRDGGAHAREEFPLRGRQEQQDAFYLRVVSPPRGRDNNDHAASHDLPARSTGAAVSPSPQRPRQGENSEFYQSSRTNGR